MKLRFTATAPATFHAGRMRPRPAGRIANTARIVFGLFYLTAALFNTFVMFPHPELYQRMVEPALIPLYKTFTTRIIAPYAPFWTVLLVLGEVSLALLILSKKVWVKIGLVGGMLWCVFVNRKGALPQLR